MHLDRRTPSRPQLWLGYFLVVAFGLLVHGLSSTQQWEGRLRDLGFRWLASNMPIAVKTDVVLVGLDDEDLKSFGVPAAMLHRELGAFLEAMAVVGPKAVGLDVLLPSTSFDKLQAGLDAALARGIIAARTSTSLVLGIGTDSEGRARALHPLFSSLAGPDRLGYVFLHSEPDGVIRRFDERLGSLGEQVPTLAGQMARSIGIKPAAGLINYALGGRFSYIPLRQVLAWRESGQIDTLRHRFGGKVVMLGSTLAFDDQHRAPIPLSAWIEGATTSHGVLIHAQQLRNLLNGTLVQELPTLGKLLGFLLLGAIWWLRPGLVSWGVALALLAALLVGSVFLLRAGLTLPSLSWSLVLVTGVGARTGWAGWQAALQRSQLRDTFGGFVSPAVLEEILAGRLAPNVAGTRREVCVLFSDIRGFTGLSESMPPEQVTGLLNRYFDLMAAPVHQQGGMLDKFIGDGIMAVFGAPAESSAPCDDALAAARAMIASLEHFNQAQRQRGETEIKIGIGLHFGPAILGYVGSKDRFEYSAIGDTVNAAARIEGMTKDAGFPLLLSSKVLERLCDKSGIIAIGPIEIRGRSSMDLFGWKP